MAIMSNRKLSYLAYFYDTVHPIKKAGTFVTNASACSKSCTGFNVFTYHTAIKSSAELFIAEGLFVKGIG